MITEYVIIDAVETRINIMYTVLFTYNGLHDVSCTRFRAVSWCCSIWSVPRSWTKSWKLK